MQASILQYIPFLIPIIIINLILMLIALFHLFKHKSFRFGNIYIWIPIVVFVQFIGPILYFTIGKSDNL